MKHFQPQNRSLAALCFETLSSTSTPTNSSDAKLFPLLNRMSVSLVFLQVTELTQFLLENFTILGENIPSLLDTDEGKGTSPGLDKRIVTQREV